jgi:hypothetical protein
MNIEDIDILESGYAKRVKIKFRSDRTYTDWRGIEHTFRAGDVSDGHSTPMLFRGWFPPIDEALPAAFIHDRFVNGTTAGRCQYDSDYRKNLAHYGQPFAVRWLKYYGACGGSLMAWVGG